MAANDDKPVDGKLVSYVHVADERGTFSAFGPDDEVPEWAARKMGAHCWEGGVHPIDGEKANDDGEKAEDKSPATRRRSSAH